MHVGTSGPTPDANDQTIGTESVSAKVGTMLQTAKVLVQGQNGKSACIRMLFDTGADTTYVSASLVKKLEPEWITARSVSYAAFGEDKPSSSKIRNVYKLGVQNKLGRIEYLRAIEVNTICAPLHKPCVPRETFQSCVQFELADDFQGSAENVTIDIVLGLDHYWNVMKSGLERLPGGLVLQESVFGWILSGSWCEANSDGHSHSDSSPQLISHQLVCLSDMPDISKFWNLEVIGVSGSNEKPDLSRDPVIQRFNNSVTLVEGRYEVRLPWKNPDAKLNLLDNRKQAEIRLRNPSRKLDKDSSLKTRYGQVFGELEVEGIIGEIDQLGDLGEKAMYYMPHRPVVNESKVSTKVRPVFDASAKAINGISLNDCLETGPCLLRCLVDTLIRFRRWRVGLTADIAKAFLQIRVHPDDQDVHRFLLSDQGYVREMKFLRVPFGNTSSPFLLNATIKHHLSKYPKSRAVVELEDNLYVDDLLTGADFDNEVPSYSQKQRK
ncbi:uncharacterized protein LOC135501732 [Lineus longissimus]|uniref:uncharacterized protein LOC135501732 n=1 Tax=Lineus longissimus TaxID=88925 RepID=UPI00315C7662